MKKALQILILATTFLSFASCKEAPKADKAAAATAVSDIRTLAQTDYPAAMQMIDRSLRAGEIGVFEANNLKANITYLYTEDYGSAAVYMRKALQQEEAADPVTKTGLLYHLATILKGGKQYTELLAVCKEGAQAARDAGLPFEQQSFDFMAGTCLFDMGEESVGLSMMKDAVEKASAEAKTEEQYGHLLYFQSTITNDYKETGDFEEVLLQCVEYEELLGKMQRKFPDADPGYIDRCLFYQSADRAICHANLGDRKKADEYFQEALKYGFASTQGGLMRQVDYFAAIGNPQCVLEIYQNEIPFPDADTVSRAWRLRLSRIMQAYHHAGIQEKENEYQARYDALSHLIEEKERSEETKVKAAQYDASSSRARLSDTRLDLKKSRRTTNILIILFIIALAGAIVVFHILSRRSDELHNKQAEALQKELESIRRQVSIIAEKEPHKGTPRLKAPITKLIEENKLYLNKDISRAAVASMLGVPEQEIPKMLNAVKPGLGFPEYINSLRIRYALEIMALNPDITVTDLADRSGFYTKRTFQRAFQSATGKTPSEYARELKDTNS